MSKNLLQKLETTLESGILLQYVDDSLATKQVLYKLGFAGKGQYVQIVRNFLINNEIDISHFTHNGKQILKSIVKTCLCCGKEFRVIPRKEKEQVVCSRSCSNTYFRSGKNHPNYIDGGGSYRKKALDTLGKSCFKCGYDNEDALEVHHLDKNRNNNELSNLIVLCANCHTLTHKNKI